MSGNMPVWAFLVVAVIGSGGFGALVPWLLNRLDKANPERAGLRLLLFLKLQAIHEDMVRDDGVCPTARKRDAEAIYTSYHALGGNGVGTSMIEDIREAHIKPNQEN